MYPYLGFEGMCRAIITEPNAVRLRPFAGSTILYNLRSQARMDTAGNPPMPYETSSPPYTGREIPSISIHCVAVRAELPLDFSENCPAALFYNRRIFR